MENLLQQIQELSQHTFTLRDILTTPVPLACLGIFSYLFTGARFRDYLTRWFVRYRKDSTCLCDSGLEWGDEVLIQVARFTFPVSGIAFILIRLLAFVGNKLASPEHIHKTAMKEKERLEVRK